MTRLFIDGKEVILSSDFELDLYRENPFFTRNGDYTYDIDVDLYVPQNSLLYKSINRTDVTSKFSNRSAVVIADGVTVVKGTEIVLSVDSRYAKIQIVSGNSELNYISSKESIRNLNLGMITATKEEALIGLDYFFPDRNYVYPPVYVGYKDNQSFSFNNQMTIQETGTIYNEDTVMIPQPFFLFVVEKVIEAIGYRLQENELRNDPRWCRLIMINGIKTESIAEMLPDWTIDEFLDEVEKFFNCVILIDQTEKTAHILRTDGYYANVDSIEIDMVVDTDKEKTYDVVQNLYVDYDSVQYEFPDYDEYKYMCLDSSVKKLCEVKTLNSIYESWSELTENYDKHIIYQVGETCFVGHRESETSTPGLKVVDRFSKVNETEENVATLKVIPAETFVGITGTIGSVGSGVFVAAYARNNNDYNNTTTDETGLNELIKNGVSEEDVPEKLYIAYYLGKQGVFSAAGTTQVQLEYWLPMTASDTVYYVYEDSPPYSFLLNLKDSTLTLALNGENGLYQNYYANNVKVNTRDEYTFRFNYSGLLDPKQLFLINNKLYYCKQLHYVLNSNGFDKIVEGIFYLIGDSSV